MARLPKLMEMIEASPVFTDPNYDGYEPLDQQVIYRKMANSFQQSISNLYSDPQELAMELGMGTELQWEAFLNLEPVQLYITTRTRNLTEVAARKSMSALQKAARNGDVNAIKHLNDISGVLKAQGDNRTIILTTVPRPERKQVSQ